MIVGKNYSISGENLLAHELIGLNVEVSKCNDISRIGFNGRIVFETKNTFSIESKNVEKIVPKNECNFLFFLGEEKFEVDGKFLVEKPENRVKSFLKKNFKIKLMKKN